MRLVLHVLHATADSAKPVYARGAALLLIRAARVASETQEAARIWHTRISTFRHARRHEQEAKEE